MTNNFISKVKITIFYWCASVKAELWTLFVTFILLAYFIHSSFSVIFVTNPNQPLLLGPGILWDLMALPPPPPVAHTVQLRCIFLKYHLRTNPKVKAMQWFPLKLNFLCLYARTAPSLALFFFSALSSHLTAASSLPTVP